MATSAGAILVCALMLAFIAGHGDSPKTWQPPGDRSLSSTVRVALFQPSFSNRSIGSVVGYGFLALLVLGGSVYFFASAAHQSGLADRPARAID
jgi:hypothetical protein